MTGASGLVGRHVIRQLVARGDRPIALSRRQTLTDMNVPQVEVRAGDLRDPASIAHASDRCHVIIHAAGELFDDDQMRHTNVGGMKNLLAALSPTVRQLIVVSSIGVIGPVSGRKIGEDTPCRPANLYEETKLEAERLALNFSRQTGLRVTALRPTIVFGERVGTGPRNSFLSLLRAIAAKRFVYFSRRACANYIYAGDVAGACIAALESDPGGVIHINDPCRLDEFISAAADALGVRRPRVTIPRAVAYALAVTMEAASMIVRRPMPLTVNRVRALTSRTVYVSDRIPDDLPWRPAIGYAEGLARTVAYYRNAGLLG